jgi:drug/metabolite transporter (DMT)-like permease
LAESVSTPAPQPAAPAHRGSAAVAVLSAWLLPGLGHVYLKRRLRGIAFLVLVAAAILIGCKLEGNLYTPVPGQPLTYLATIGSMGMGFPYFLLRYGLSYQGDVRGAAYEYGTAFLLTAGLMNWLLVLDAWDIVRGKKE